MLPRRVWSHSRHPQMALAALILLCVLSPTSVRATQSPGLSTGQFTGQFTGQAANESPRQTSDPSSNQVGHQLDNSQAFDRLILVDADTGTALAGVNYVYGDMHGVADADGAIRITYRAGVHLILTHVAYSRHTLGDAAVRQALAHGSLSLAMTPQAMHPIAVLGTRPRDGALTPDVQDRVEHDAGSFLQRIPALSAVRKSGSYGFDPVLRGFKHDQLNLLIDGALTAMAACPNRMDPPSSQVAMNAVERVEIHKGPHSFRFGNAFAGTVNFASPVPQYASQAHVLGRASSSYAGNGQTSRTEAMLGFRGPAYDASLLGSWSRGEDFTDGADTQIPGQFLRGSFAARVGWRVAGNQDLVLTATRNLARDVDFPALPMDLRDDDTWLLNARYEGRWPLQSITALRLNVHASHVDHRMDNLLRPAAMRSVDAVTEAQTATWGARTEAELADDDRRIFLGADLLVEQADGERQRTFLQGPMVGMTAHDNVWQEAQIVRQGLFAEWHAGTGSTRWVLSSRVEIDLAEAGDPADEFVAFYNDMTSTQVNPGLSIGVRRQLDAAWSVGLWVARAQRSGGLTERYINSFPVGLDRYEMLGNPDLDPEINNQVDLSVVWNRGAATRVEVDLFASYLQDLISSRVLTDRAPRLPTAAGVRQYVNIRDARVVGFEILWEQHLAHGWNHRFVGAFSRGQDLVRDEPLPEIPPLDLSYTLMGSYLGDRLRPEVSMRHVSKQDRVSAAFGEGTTPGFQVLDLQVSWEWAPHWLLSASVENLLDEAYYEHLSRATRGAQARPIYSTGRNLMLILSTRWI